MFDRKDDLARLLAALSAGLGAVGLAGWYLNWSIVRFRLFDLPLMVPATALALVALGVALLALLTPGRGPRAQLASRAIALAGIVLGGGVGIVAILEYLGVGSGLTGMFARSIPDYSILPNSGLPFPSTAVALVGMAMALVGWRMHHVWVPSVFALLAMAQAWLALLGYLFNARLLFPAPDAGMAPATAAAILLWCGAVATSRARLGGMFGILHMQGAARVVLLRFLPVAILTPLVVGLFNIEMERRRLLDVGTTEAVSMIIFTGVVLLGLDRTIRAVRTAEVERERLLKTAGELELRNKLDLEKDQFLSMISHDLRTPLHAISGYGSLLEDEIPGRLNATQHKYVAKILEGTRQLTGLVEDLLDITLISSGRLVVAPVELHFSEVRDTALDLVRPFAEAKGVTLSSRGPDMVVLADPRRTVQILTNLLGNAIKFTPGGGAVTLHARPCGAHACIEVADTGCGLPDPCSPQIFEPYYQCPGHQVSQGGQTAGAGLGLAIVKGLVVAHGGAVMAENRPGGGALFRFTLPLASVEPTSPAEAATTGERRDTGR